MTVEGFQIAFFWAPEKGPYDSFPVEPIIYESYLDLFGCIYMTNNVKSCQKINGFTEIFGDFSPEERVEEACKEENPQVAIHLMPNSDSLLLWVQSWRILQLMAVISGVEI